MTHRDGGLHVLFNGHHRRNAEPRLSKERRRELVSEMLTARRDLHVARQAHDAVAEASAREQINAIKLKLSPPRPALASVSAR